MEIFVFIISFEFFGAGVYFFNQSIDHCIFNLHLLRKVSMNHNSNQIENNFNFLFDLRTLYFHLIILK